MDHYTTLVTAATGRHFKLTVWAVGHVRCNDAFAVFEGAEQFGPQPGVTGTDILMWELACLR